MISENRPDLDGIVLVRLLVRPEKFKLSELVSNLESLLWLNKAEARKAAEASLARLKERGFIWPDTRFLLTDEGQTAALAQLGYSHLPKRQRLDWRRARKALVARRLGRTSPGALAHAGKSDHVAAWVIAIKEGLKLRGEPTPRSVLQALAWRALGLPDGGPLAENAGVGAVLGLVAPEPQSPLLETPAPQPRAPEARSPKTPVPVPPEPTAPPTSPAAEALPAFGRRVNELARSARDGRWLGDKIFIAQVWKDFTAQKPDGDLPLARFKQRLVEAARAGLILLSRADLVSAYPQEELRLSQIEAGGELYHFVETQHLG